MIKTQVLVIGSGPGGYTAAFRAADLGKKVTVIERYDNLGGVCLNVGCIPSKTLLHTAEVINEAKRAEQIGVHFGKTSIDIDGVRKNKEDIVKKLTSGINALAQARKIKVINGHAHFISPNQVGIDGSEEVIEFEDCIIAVGSRITKIPLFPFDDKRVMDSTDALELSDIPKRLLVVGGGIIGVEMAEVYAALGSKITIVELEDQLIAGADKDVVNPLFKIIKNSYENIYLRTKVVKISTLKKGIKVFFEGNGAPESDIFDKVLVSVGRSPNGAMIGADKAGVLVDECGFIATDRQMKTNVEHIYAIGDVVCQPMLAHKAVHEAKVAAEVICGHKSGFDVLTIPSVVYTNPEVAWTGKTEKELKAAGVAYEKGVFPWAASGRALSVGSEKGVTKGLFDSASGKILGMGICGANAGDLIAEATLAIEMGCDMSDIAMTIHAHPTLSETTAFAAEMASGTITDLIPPKKRK